MRRRGKSTGCSAGYGSIGAHFNPYGERLAIHNPRIVTIAPVPKEWSENAAMPWRILFPDLDWTPPDRDL